MGVSDANKNAERNESNSSPLPIIIGTLPRSDGDGNVQGSIKAAALSYTFKATAGGNSRPLHRDQLPAYRSPNSQPIMRMGSIRESNTKNL